jgi:hypothetical protein
MKAYNKLIIEKGIVPTRGSAVLRLFVVISLPSGKFRDTTSKNWPVSSVGIATGYGLDGAGIESRRGRDFSHTSRPAHPPSCAVGTGSFPGVKRPGRGADHPPPSSAKDKKG